MEKKRIGSFEGLRGIFALLIFLNHCNFIAYWGKECELVFEHIFHNGSFCVMFFFLLSGFCTYIGYGEKFDTICKESYIAFLKRRISKLFLPYVVSMIWAMLYRCVVYGETVGKNIVKLFLSATMLQTISVKYWDILNSAAWFVSCIWVIYWFAPFILKGLNKIDSRSKLILLLVILYIIRILIHTSLRWESVNYVYLVKSLDLLEYVWPFVRIIDFAMGMVLGRIFFLKSSVRGGGTLMEVLSSTGVCITWLLSINVQSVQENAVILIIPMLLWFIYTFAFDTGAVSRILSGGIWSYFGKYSMEIYLFHYVVIWFGGWFVCEKLIGDYSLGILFWVIVALFGATLAVSIAVKKIQTLYSK